MALSSSSGTNSSSSGGNSTTNVVNRATRNASSSTTITALISKLQQSFTDAMSPQKMVVDKRVFDKTYKNMDKVSRSFPILSTFLRSCIYREHDFNEFACYCALTQCASNIAHRRCRRLGAGRCGNWQFPLFTSSPLISRQQRANRILKISISRSTHRLLLFDWIENRN